MVTCKECGKDMEFHQVKDRDFGWLAYRIDKSGHWYYALSGTRSRALESVKKGEVS